MLHLFMSILSPTYLVFIFKTAIYIYIWLLRRLLFLFVFFLIIGFLSHLYLYLTFKRAIYIYIVIIGFFFPGFSVLAFYLFILFFLIVAYLSHQIINYLFMFPINVLTFAWFLFRFFSLVFLDGYSGIVFFWRLYFGFCLNHSHNTYQNWIYVVYHLDNWSYRTM